MSIPRDLKVEIPGVGTEKFNAAYTYGGPKLTLRVVKELTGLQINHVVNVDFLGFVRAVNAIGCVYTDVDRRYYHSNVGVPPSEQYSEINIQPGYQLLCGKEALEYVRYRHTDTDLVRSARQQDFISAARERVPISKLVLGQNDLIDIFTKYTTSDIANAETMLQVLKLFIASRNAAIKEVHFPATLGPSYVYASENAIHGAVEPVPRDRSERRAARLAGRQQRGRQEEERRQAQGEEAPPGQAEAAGQRRPGPGLRSRRARGEDGRPQGRRRLPGLLPDPAAVRRHLRGKQQLRTRRRTRASTTSRTPKTIATAPTGWWSSFPCRTESTTSACRASRAGRTRRSSTSPASTRRSTGANTTSSSTANGSRWSPGTAANNTYWVSNDLLDTLTKRPDDRDRALGERDPAEAETEAERGEGMSGGDESRLEWSGSAGSGW